MQSTSMSKLLGHAGTLTKTRAGGSIGKYRAYTTFDGSKLLHRGAVHCALQDPAQRRAGPLQAQLHLLKHKLSLTLDRRVRDFACIRVEGWQTGNVDRIPMPRDHRCWRLPPLKES